MKLKFHFLLFTAVLLLASCKRNNDGPLWKVDLLTPMVQSSLSIANLIKDTSNVKTNADNSITIVSRQELANVTLDSLVVLDTEPFSETITLSSLVLPTRYDTTRITIGSIANALIATGDPDNVNLGNGLIFAATYGFPIDLSTIPALSFQNIGVDISGFFQTANIATGTLTIKIVNNLPATIQSLHFDFKNQSDGSPVSSHTFTNIAALGGSDSYVEDLAGKQVEGMLLGDIAPLQLAGSPNTIVTLEQAIEVIMTITGVTVNSAIAVFPDQDIMQKQEETSLKALGDVLLTKAVIDSGFMKMHIVSTLQEAVSFTYIIPNALKDGVPFQQTAYVPAAPSSTEPAVRDVDFDLEGYAMDFTGIAGDTFNTFFYTLTARIISSGNPVPLALTDYMTVTVSGVGLKPVIVEGYLGQNTFSIGPDIVNLDIFKGIESGTLNFENIDMRFVVDNGFGIDAEVVVNDMTSRNLRTGQQHTLSPLPLTFAINRAPSPGLSTVNNGSLGTDATALINVLPDQVSYNVQVKTNPAGNTNTYTDFAQQSALMKAYLDIEMPLSIMASQLVLGDTADFNTSMIKKRNVNSGTFKIFVNNGFPLNASLRMYFLDVYGTVVDSVKSLPDAILAAPVNALNKVSEKRASEILFEADEETMKNLYNSTKVIFKIEFTTLPASTFMKIYSDYAIDFKMVGDLDYSVQRK